MAYKYKERYLKVGSPWLDDDGIQHRYNWAASWSADDLKKWGISIEEDTNNSFDSRFYLSKDVARSLNDVNVVDDEGKAVLDTVTGKQTVTIGLKNEYINSTKQEAHRLLSKSDWYITRKAETDEAIPSDISTYRAAVKTAVNNIETKINACSDLASFMALFNVPEGETKAPMYDWPDEVS